MVRILLCALLCFSLAQAGCKTTTTQNPDGSVVTTGPDWTGVVEIINATRGIIAEVGDQYGEEIAAAASARLLEWVAENEEDRARALRDEQFRQELILRFVEQALDNDITDTLQGQ